MRFFTPLFKFENNSPYLGSKDYASCPVMGFNYKLRKDVFILMTILETFIKLRDDLKTWVTNNLNQKANISYVDEKIAGISAFDPTDIITDETIDAICGETIKSANEVMF